MKTNIDVTVQVSDEQRVQLANVLDGKVSRRQATRVEVKEFIWDAGREWETALAAAFRSVTGQQDDLDDIL